MHQETNCCCVLYSYFRGVLIFAIFVVNTRVTKFSKFRPTLQLCLHVLMFGLSNAFYSPFSLLVPCWQCPWSIGSPFSSCPACGDGGREQRSEQGRSTNGASMSHSDMPAPMEFVLCRRGSLQCKTWHWSTPSFLWSRIPTLSVKSLAMRVQVRRDQYSHRVYRVWSSHHTSISIISSHQILNHEI